MAVKTVKKEDVNVKSAPAKTVPAKDTKATAPVAPAPKSKKVVEPPPPPPPSNLPKLPKGFVLKKQKGKLAPGEKRIFKTNVITHHVISDVPLDELDKKGKPEPKGKFHLEYIIHTPVTLLYDFLTTPNGLAEWFADGVDLKNDIYTFDWDGQKQNAKIISAKIDNHIRMRWLDKPEGSYFEFRLNQDELTNEVSLNITDFGEGDDDIATSRRLWDSQIHRLVKALGTY
ncbi:MAG: START-like domain-containing protein [Bacteroidota bacterium]|nr:START-like domain-containing protein [Bacteroidota bacterium]